MTLFCFATRIDSVSLFNFSSRRHVQIFFMKYLACLLFEISIHLSIFPHFCFQVICDNTPTDQSQLSRLPKPLIGIR